MRRVLAVGTALAVTGVGLAPAAAAHPGGALRRASIATDGAQGDGPSFGVSVSADGRQVAFSSGAANLVPGDGNGHEDVFVRDLRSGRTVRVSVASGGGEAVGFDSRAASLSAGGRYVAFQSRAGNLVEGDTNGATDVFVHDLWSRRTEKVSLGEDGGQAEGGRGRAAGQPSISADGRYVAFIATFPDLVAGDTNEASDVFVRDRWARRTWRVSVATSGAQAGGISVTPSISADGRRVAFTSSAADLVAGDSNGATDIFVRDLRRGRTERVSVDGRGRQAAGNSTHPAISADGRQAVFSSAAPDLVAADGNGVYDVFVRDMGLGRTERVSVDSGGRQGSDASGSAGVSADGRFVAFTSSAPDLVPGDSNGVGDVFLRDRWWGRTVRLSVGPRGAQGDGHFPSATPALSYRGDVVAFESTATNLVKGDTNGAADVFVRR